jgi:beta-lactamase superfamily II metal-dependent hydrolase
MNILKDTKHGNMESLTRAIDLDWVQNDHQDLNDSFSVYVFPANSGDCSLISCGNNYILIDGGFPKTFKQYAWNVISRIPQINLMIVTHHDADHASGLMGFMQDWNTKQGRKAHPQVQQLWIAEENNPNASWRKPSHVTGIVSAYAMPNNIFDPIRGHVHNLHENCVITVINPSKVTRENFEKYFEKKQNEASICLHVECNNHKAVFTGDANDKDILDGLRDIYPQGIIELDYIDVPHHGSEAHHDPNLWNTIQSKVYMISCDHRHKNPKYQTLKTIADSIIQSNRQYDVHILCTFETPSITKLRDYITQKQVNNIIIDVLQTNNYTTREPANFVAKNYFKINLDECVVEKE